MKSFFSNIFRLHQLGARESIFSSHSRDSAN